jgi:phosphoglycerol transferase MdoB-like AlkP superfamily enzyme
VAEWTVKQRIVFWWIAFLTIQQVERWFLLPDVIHAEPPGVSVLVDALATGFRADLIMSTMAVLAVALAAGLVSVVWWAAIGRSLGTAWSGSYGRLLTAAGIVTAVLLVVLLLLDIGYYRYNQQRLNFVFFEYLGDLLVQWKETGVLGSQAAGQTEAELEAGGKWAGLVLGFVFCESAAVLAWSRVFSSLRRRWAPLASGRTVVSNVALLLALAVGLTGFHPRGPEAIRAADISNAAYYTLAQNPVLYAGEGLRAALDAQWKSDQGRVFAEMPLSEAIRATRDVIGPKAVFPYPDYPLVHRTAEASALRLPRPANILIIFVEALDRRYLNKTVGGVQVTPFLDRLRSDSVYFEHFFANGVQTARGLFSTLCSYYPRQGTAAMKTHYLHDYACLPSVLRERGYRTEMVIGYDRDINRLHVFMARNGLHALFDRTSFPATAEEIGAFAGIGRPDGALLDLMRTRVEALRATASPYCLVAMTIGTHHPFAIPASRAAHPDIRALQTDPDGYLASLRYVDLELERVLTAMKRDGLLKDTVVLILGDHARHEKVGQSEFERQAGHFMTPLFVWVDDSLRTPGGYQPRTVTTVASQVDVLPTILGLNGEPPRLSASLGRNLSCLLQSDCAEDNVAFLSSVYDDLIGLADADGLLLYSLRSRTVRRADLDLNEPAVVLDPENPAVAHRYRRLLALYVASNTILNQNKIWSWKEFGAKP